MRWLGYAGGLGLGLLLGWACTEPGGDCAVGSLDCPCTVGGACDPGLTCVADSCIVIDCPVGREGCPCTGGGACDPGLTCDAGTCVDGSATSGPSPMTNGTTIGGTADEDSGDIKLDVGADDLPVGPCMKTGCTRVDMLFAIDSTASMNEEIAALSASQSFSAIVDALEDLNCGGIEYRIGLTNDNDGGFIGSGGQPWFDSNEMTADEIASAFTIAASTVLGSGSTPVGCEHVLGSSVSALALDTTGFLRPDALLVLVLVTDVDDYGAYDQMGFGGICDGFLCTETPQPIQALYDNLVTLKGGDPAGVAAIVVAGDPTVTEGMNTCGQPASCCGMGLGECAQAHHATRLYEFAAMLEGTNGYTGDICNGAAMIPVLIQDALGNDIDLACQTYEPPG